MTGVVVVKTNLPEFVAELRQFGGRMERNIAQAGLRAAGRVFRDEARRRAPVLRQPRKGRTQGALRNALRIARSRFSRKGAPQLVVYVRASKAQRKRGVDPFYWYFLEGGWIPRGPGQKFKGGARRRALERRRAAAAGARRIAYPFLLPAFRAMSSTALQKFNEAVEAGIQREQIKGA